MSLARSTGIAMAGLLSLLVSGNARAQIQTSLSSNVGKPIERIKRDGSNLFRVLEASFDSVAFLGQRNYVQRGRNGKLTRYEEEIAILPKLEIDPKDPMHRRASFRLKLAGLPKRTPPPSMAEIVLMYAEFISRSGFIHYQRDFRVYDSRRAAENYNVVPMGILIRSGRPVRIFDVLPKLPARPSYRILVDVEYQVVLGQLELSPSRRFNNALVYRTMQFGAKARASMANINDWWTASLPVSEHASLAKAETAAGFTVNQPKNLPRGFALHSIRTASDPSKLQKSKYVVMIYSDGIETFYLIQVLSSGKAWSTVKIGNKRIVKVFHYESGPAGQYYAESKGRGYLLIGKFPQANSKVGAGVPTFFAGLLR